MKKMRALDKKNMARLNVEQRARLQEMRDRKEVGRFLMPDAPPNKKRRNVSPVRVTCPLIPGTPEVPPPHIPQAWELEKLGWKWAFQSGVRERCSHAAFLDGTSVNIYPVHGGNCKGRGG